MKVCNICKQQKDYSEFHKNRLRKDGYEIRCKACKSDKHKNWVGRVEGRATKLLHNCIRRANKKGEQVTITREWIADRIREGCPLTGVQFDLSRTDSAPWIPSVDRIDSSQGYTPENCRVVCQIANLAKNEWSDDVVYEFAKLLLKDA